MKKDQSVVVVDIEAIYNSSSAGKKTRKHLYDVQNILMKGLEDAEKAFSEQSNKDALISDAKQKIEKQFAIEQYNAKKVLSRAIDESVKQWRDENKNNILVIPAGSVLSYSPHVDITEDILSILEGKRLVFNALPEVEIKNDKK